MTCHLDPALVPGLLVSDADGIANVLAGAGVELFMPPETRWYRTGEKEGGVQQFVVSDPDGYLIRFQSSIGGRPTV